MSAAVAGTFSPIPSDGLLHHATGRDPGESAVVRVSTESYEASPQGRTDNVRITPASGAGISLRYVNGTTRLTSIVGHMDESCMRHGAASCPMESPRGV
jgi:hypothetical protein